MLNLEARCLVGVVLSLVACSSSPDVEPASKPREPPPAAPRPAASEVVAEPSDEAAHLYDPAVVHTFDVEIAPTDLALADSDPSAELYVPARLRFEGKTYEVGYRYK